MTTGINSSVQHVNKLILVLQKIIMYHLLLNMRKHKCSQDKGTQTILYEDMSEK